MLYYYLLNTCEQDNFILQNLLKYTLTIRYPIFELMKKYLHYYKTEKFSIPGMDSTK